MSEPEGEVGTGSREALLQRIAVLEAKLALANEMWTDSHGTLWHRPSAEQYACTYTALQKSREITAIAARWLGEGFIADPRAPIS